MASIAHVVVLNQEGQKLRNLGTRNPRPPFRSKRQLERGDPSTWMNGLCLLWNFQASSTHYRPLDLMIKQEGSVHCTEVRRELCVRTDQHRECADAIDTPEGSHSFLALAQFILFLQGLLHVLRKPHQRFMGPKEG